MLDQQRTTWGKWDCLMKRLKEASRSRLTRNTDGIAIVQISIILDAHGAPVGWTEPRVFRIEPSNMDWIAALCGEVNKT